MLFQAELLVLTSSLHPSEEGEEEKEESSLEEEVVEIEQEEEEEVEVEKATRRESQPYFPPPEVVTARAERVVWQRSLPRDFEFSPGLEEDEPVEFEDLRESDDVEVVEVDGDEEEEEEEEETSGELGSWDHDLQEQYIRWKYGKHKKSRMTDEKYSIEENVDNSKFLVRELLLNRLETSR